MVVRGDLTMSLKDLVLRYLFNKNAKIFLKYFWAIQFLKLEKMVMKTLLFNTKT